MKIEAASQERIDSLIQWVETILKAMDHTEAFVTDESLIADFRPYCGKDIPSQRENEKWLKSISNLIGLEINMREYIIDIALKLKEKENGRLSKTDAD
jgi:hypothetical protein